MLKRAVIFVLALALPLCTVAEAVSPRAISVVPHLSFSGTTATCRAVVTEDLASSYLVVTMKLWVGNTCLKTWSKAGTSRVQMTETTTVTKGQTYTLTVDVMVNGTSRPQQSITRTC